MGKFKDISGQKFGMLTAIRRTDKKFQRQSIWECQCECGNIKEVPISALTSGNTKSCGCLKTKALVEYNQKQSEMAKIPIGTKFGKLTVIEDIGFKEQVAGHNRRWYKCLCDCGQEKEVMGNRLKNKQVQSCGNCDLNSIGEYNIIQILKENNIIFEHDKSYLPLNEEYNKKLRFDFIIYDKNKQVQRFIEFDGRQHIKGPDTDFWSRTTDTLESIQERDKIKNDFCLKNNIPLVRIPYHKKNNITLEDLLGDKYLVKGDD